MDELRLAIFDFRIKKIKSISAFVAKQINQSTNKRINLKK